MPYDNIYSILVWKSVALLIVSVLPILLGLITWLWVSVDKKIESISDEIIAEIKDNSHCKLTDIEKSAKELYDKLEELARGVDETQDASTDTHELLIEIRTLLQAFIDKK